MAPGTLLRLAMVMIGIFLFVITVVCLAKRKLTEPFTLVWGFVALIIGVAGVCTNPSRWEEFISAYALVMLVLLVICIIGAAFFVTMEISRLMIQNNELAMQVSLLKEENDRIISRLGEMDGESSR